MLGAKMSPTPYQPFSPQYNQIAQKLELLISDFTEKEQLLAYILQKKYSSILLLILTEYMW